MLKQLRVKFVCVNMVIVTAMLCAMLSLVVWFNLRSMEARSVQTLQAIAAEPFRLGMQSEFQQEGLLPYFSLEISRQGDVLVTGSSRYDLTAPTVIRDLLEQVLSRRETTGILQDYGLRYYRVISPSGQTIAFADLSSEEELRTSLIYSCLLIGLAGFGMFFFISLLLARWAVKPVEETWEQQKQFVADASHELKTPLTVILTNAELLQTPGCPPLRQEQCVGNILTMSRQMRGLVESLLQLARLDSSAFGMIFSYVDLSDLLAEAALPFEPLFFEQGLTLDTQIEPSIGVSGSDQHLRQVADILLDNALKYSNPGGAVCLGLRRTGSHCLMTVSNPGPAISREDLTNIFKRFYRADKSHSAGGSYGLGLSIAQRMVSQHRGKLWAESREGVNTFCVQLPLARGVNQ